MKKIEKVDLIFNNFINEIYPDLIEIKDDIISLDAFLKREHSIDSNCLNGSLFARYDNDRDIYSLKLLRDLGINRNKNLVNKLKSYYTRVNDLTKEELLELNSLLILYLNNSIDYKYYKNLIDSLKILESEEVILINRLLIIYNNLKENGKISSNKIFEDLLKDEIIIKKSFYNKLSLNKSSFKSYVKYYIDLCEDLDKKHLSSYSVLYYIRKCHRYFL